MSTFDVALIAGFVVAYGLISRKVEHSLVVGCLGALAVRGASRRAWMEGIYRQLSVLGIAVAAFAVAAEFGGNGFIAMFVGGPAS